MATNVKILCDDSTRIKKTGYFTKHNVFFKLQAETGFKFIISAFPYSKNLTWEYRRLEHVLVKFGLYRHSDAIFFCINKFINNFILTTDTMYLANRFKIQIVTLLAFNLQVTLIGNAKKSLLNDVHINTSTNICTLCNNNSVSN